MGQQWHAQQPQHVKRRANDNTVGKLRVEHMAAPAEVGSELEVYVAWSGPRVVTDGKTSASW